MTNKVVRSTSQFFLCIHFFFFFFWTDRNPHQKDLSSWFQAFGLQKYTDEFLKQEIALETLSFLSEENMVQLGLTRLGTRLKLRFMIHSMQQMKPDSSSSLPVPSISETFVGSLSPSPSPSPSPPPSSSPPSIISGAANLSLLPPQNLLHSLNSNGNYPTLPSPQFVSSSRSALSSSGNLANNPHINTSANCSYNYNNGGENEYLMPNPLNSSGGSSPNHISGGLPIPPPPPMQSFSQGSVKRGRTRSTSSNFNKEYNGNHGLPPAHQLAHFTLQMQALKNSVENLTEAVQKLTEHVQRGYQGPPMAFINPSHMGTLVPPFVSHTHWMTPDGIPHEYMQHVGQWDWTMWLFEG